MRSALVPVVLLACGNGHKATPDAPVTGDAPIDMASNDAGNDANLFLPDTLFATRLCVDRASTQISPGIYTYTPSYALWSDGATKRRWMQLPPGGHIDTSDPDHWKFPIGTKFWKEFTAKDGSGNDVRVETRFIQKNADNGDQNDWFYVAYQWNETQDDTTAVPFGQLDADGTQHDIPSRIQCRTCHENLSSRILGFGAIQLDHAAAPGEIAIDDLSAMHWVVPELSGSAPHYPLPGTGSAKDAIGYLHANCGHCHNPDSKVYTDQGINMELRLTVATLGALSTTPVYQTAVDHDAMSPINGHTKRIVSGDPQASILIDRFEADPMGSLHMPLLGSEVMDPTADATLRDWITNIQ
jgi:hypothetical protein